MDLLALMFAVPGLLLALLVALPVMMIHEWFIYGLPPNPWLKRSIVDQLNINERYRRRTPQEWLLCKPYGYYQNRPLIPEFRMTTKK